MTSGDETPAPRRGGEPGDAPPHTPPLTPAPAALWSVTRAFALMALLLLAAAGGIVYFLPQIAKPIAVALLRDLDASNIDFTIGAIGWRSATIEDVRVARPGAAGADLTIDRATLRYTLTSLLHGRAARLDLHGVVVRGRAGPGGVDLGSVSTWIEQAGAQDGPPPEAMPPVPPVSTVTVRDAAVLLTTPQGVVELAGDGDIALAAEHTTAQASLTLRGALARGRAQVAASARDGTYTLDADKIALTATHPALRGSATLTQGYARLTMDALGALAGTLGGRLAYAAGAQAQTQTQNGVPVAAVQAQVASRFAYDPATGRGDLWVDDCVPLEVTPAAAATWQLADLALCPEGDAPVLTAGTAAPALATATPDTRLQALFTLPPAAFTVAELAHGTAPAVRARIAAAADGTVHTVLDLDGGDVTFGGQNVQVTGLRGRLTHTAGPPGADAAARLEIDAATLRDLQAASRFAPLDVEADLSLRAPPGQGPGAGGITGPVRVAAGGTRLARGTLTHDLAAQRGHMSFSLGPLAFGEAGLQPDVLVPALRGHVAAVSGDVSADGVIGWTADGLAASRGTLVLADLALQARAARLAGIFGTVAFSSLVPVRTDGVQDIAIGLIDAGVPLTDGVARAQISGGGDVIIDKARWPFAGGELVLTSGVLNTRAPAQRVELSAAGVDLAQVLALIDVDGLSGEGTLGGVVPIDIRDGAAYVTKARLAAEPGGAIRYASAAADAAAGTAQGANIAFKALENFRFTVMRVEIDGPVAGDLDVRVVLEGANPALYDGYPVHFNITTKGAFVELVRRGLVGFRPLDIVTGKEDLTGIDVQRVDPEGGQDGP